MARSLAFLLSVARERVIRQIYRILELTRPDNIVIRATARLPETVLDRTVAQIQNLPGFRLAPHRMCECRGAHGCTGTAAGMTDNELDPRLRGDDRRIQPVTWPPSLRCGATLPKAAAPFRRRVPSGSDGDGSLCRLDRASCRPRPSSRLRRSAYRRGR
jgi:hypothetical protein